MAAPSQSRRVKRSNLFGWGSKPAPKRKTGTGMTLARATALAKSAGAKSQDEGEFLPWLESKGLDDRSEAVQSRLRQAYFAGVESAEKPAGPRYSDTPSKAKPFKDVSYKGYRIYFQGDGFRTSADRGETEFEDVKQAKRFIDDEVKMGRNPARRRNSASEARLKMRRNVPYPRSRFEFRVDSEGIEIWHPA